MCRNYTLIFWVGTIVNQYSAVWSNSAVRFLINSAVWSIIRPFGFVFIRPSGFGRMDKYLWTTEQAISMPWTHLLKWLAHLYYFVFQRLGCSFLKQIIFLWNKILSCKFLTYLINWFKKRGGSPQFIDKQEI